MSQPITANYLHYASRWPKPQLITSSLTMLTLEGVEAMAVITIKGTELAEKLRPHLPTTFTPSLREVCSLICRSATSYAAIQEAMCNGHPACSSPTLPIETVRRLQEQHEAWTAKCDSQLERRIKELAGFIPGVKDVVFQGDPRGCTVKLAMDDGHYDDWGQEGICVPGA